MNSINHNAITHVHNIHEALIEYAFLVSEISSSIAQAGIRSTVQSSHILLNENTDALTNQATTAG